MICAAYRTWILNKYCLFWTVALVSHVHYLNNLSNSLKVHKLGIYHFPGTVQMKYQMFVDLYEENLMEIFGFFMLVMANFLLFYKNNG